MSLRSVVFWEWVLWAVVNAFEYCLSAGRAFLLFHFECLMAARQRRSDGRTPTAVGTCDAGGRRRALVCANFVHAVEEI